MKVWTKLGQLQTRTHRCAVIDHMKIRGIKVHDPVSFAILDPGIANIPFLWHGPVVHPRSGRNLDGLDRNLFSDQAQRLSKSSSCDTATDRVQTTNALVQFPAGFREVQCRSHGGDVALRLHHLCFVPFKNCRAFVKTRQVTRQESELTIEMGEPTGLTVPLAGCGTICGS